MVEKTHITKVIGKNVRVFVILHELAMTLYVAYLIFTDNSNVWIGALFGFTPAGVAMLWKACRLYGLCFAHKLMLLHVSAVYSCIIWHYEVGFGDLLPTMRWTMLLLGVLNLIYLSLKQCNQYSLWKRLRKN